MKLSCNNKSYLKWQNDLHSEINATKWKHIHSLPFKETTNSKRPTLQFRIIHRILVYRRDTCIYITSCNVLTLFSYIKHHMYVVGYKSSETYPIPENGLILSGKFMISLLQASVPERINVSLLLADNVITY